MSTYAPKQYRPERKKQDNNFVSLLGPDPQGPIMAPPLYSVIEESPEKETEKESEEKGKQPAGNQAAAGQDGKGEDGKGAAAEQKSTATKQLKSQNIGRSENPPQFKLSAGAVFQAKFASAPLQMKQGAASGGAGGGGALPEEVKAKMEGAMGANFDDVKITANSNKASEAGALAFAQGNEIHFAPGQFNPNSKGGQELIGHELAHVVQQRQGRVQANAEVNGMAVNNDHGLESEADKMGAKAAEFQVESKATAAGAAGAPSGAPAQMKLDPDAKPKSEGKEENQKKSPKSLSGDENMTSHLALDGFTERPDAEKKDGKEAPKGGDGKEGQPLDNRHSPNDAPAGEQESPEKETDEKESSADKTAKSGPQDADAHPNDGADANKGTGSGASGPNDNPAAPDQPGQEGQAAKDATDKHKAKDERDKKDADKEKDAAKDDKKAEGKEGKEGKAAAKDGKGKAHEKGHGKGHDKGHGKAGHGKGKKNGKGHAKGGGAGGGGAAEGGAGGGHEGKVMDVQPAVKGNFGEGEEPSLMVVNEAAKQEFKPESVVKDNGDGTFLVISAKAADTPAAEAPMQLAPDPKKAKPIKKKVSKAQGKAVFSSNREAVKGALSEFEAAAKGKISALEGMKGNISGQINAGAESAKNLITSTAESQKAAAKSGIDAQKSLLMSEAQRIMGETRDAMSTAKAAIAAAALTARTNVESEWKAQDAAFVALEPAQKEKFTKAFEKGKKDMQTAAEELGKLAIERGEAKAKEYDAIPTPEQSWDEDLLNGGDFEKDRHAARVKAAREVGKSYADQFKQKAQEEGDKLKGAGEAELHKYVSDSVKASRDGISQRKQAAIDQINQSETGSIASLQATCDATLASIESTMQGSISALEKQETQVITQIETTAQGKVKAVSEVAAEKVSNLEMQIQSSIDGLTNQVNQTVTGISARKNPNVAGIQKQLAQISGAIDGGVETSMSTINSLIGASIEGLNDTASESAKEITAAATAAVEGASATVKATVTGLEGQLTSFKDAAKKATDDVSKSMTLAAEAAAKEMKEQYDAVVKDFDSAQAKLDGKMAENSTAFKANIQTQLDGIDGKIKEEADKAYDAVQPRWKAWLLAAIDILVVIIITAIIIVAIASGVGILGCLLIGAVAGAVGGVLKYGAKLALTNEKFSWGKLGNAALGGAVDGVNIAAGLVLGPLGQIGVSALGGAVKYMGDVFIAGEGKFDWKTLAGKTFLGAVDGLFNVIGGKAGEGLGGFFSKKLGGVTMKILGENAVKKVTGWVVQSAVGTVQGGFDNMFENFLTTGTMDFSKFTEKLTLEEFGKQVLTNVATDAGSHHAAGGMTRAGLGDFMKEHFVSKDANANAGGNNGTNKDANPESNTNKETPVNNEQNNSSNKETPVNGDHTTNHETPVNGEHNTNKETNSNRENTTHENEGPKGKEEPTTKVEVTPEPKKLTGKEMAESLGYPKAPEGYQWVAGPEGKPYLRRESGRSADLPQVKYDPATGHFKPTVEAPQGYHWSFEGGKFEIAHNPNMADSLPKLAYDPTTGGFKDATTGKPYSGNITDVAVRGTDHAAFEKSVKGLEGDPVASKQAYEMFANKDWAGLEALFKAKGLNDGWPPNRGFISIKEGTLEVGAQFDRFGGYHDEHGVFQDKGTFIAPYGSSYEGRALPDGTHLKPLKGYEVIKPIPVKEGPAIPWFGKEGGGIQHELPMSINDLLAGGYIKPIDAPSIELPGAKKTTGNEETNTTPKKDETTTPIKDEKVTPKEENVTPKDEGPVDENTRAMSEKPEMEQKNKDLNGADMSIHFNDLSPEAKALVRKIEKQGSARVEKISPQDLANLTKWFGKEVGVLQSIYSSKLRIVIGQGKTVGGKDVRPGETFVVHTHPVYMSEPGHLKGQDIPSMKNAGKKIEGVVDLTGLVIFFNKEKVLNPTNNAGNVLPMHSDFNSGFIDKQGYIVGYGKVEMRKGADGKTRVMVVNVDE